MSYNDPSQSTMYMELGALYPKAEPSMQFVSNIFNEFEKQTEMEDKGFSPPWAVRLEKWLPANTGLIRDPIDVNWDQFRIVDKKMYAFALLRYS